MQNFSEFWPYYLAEHQLPSCRWVHFIGTTGFVSYLLWLINQEVQQGSYTLLLAFFLIILGGKLSFQSEVKGYALWILLGMISGLIWANSAVVYGIIFAYAWAWVGHFILEHNRPATFKYPLWSLAGDFRMCLEMWRGRLWTGQAVDKERLNQKGI
jgi:hypothetical protein